MLQSVSSRQCNAATHPVPNAVWEYAVIQTLAHFHFRREMVQKMQDGELNIPNSKALLV
jgi:hypothetical protein